MGLKYFKRIFLLVTILLILSGIYIIYLKDNKEKKRCTSSKQRNEDIKRN